MKQLIILSLVLAMAMACSKKENEVRPADRLPEDTINPVATLTSNDPSVVKEGLETWLRYYPNDINRVFPGEATTALGMVALRYFQASDRAPWLELMTTLLSKGADPNITFPFEGSRLGILHLASRSDDKALVTQLISRLGTVDPPLRLSCDLPREEPTQEGAVPLNVNLQEEKTGRTALHYAVEKSSPDRSYIEYLLLQGANPDIQNEALQLASPFQLVAGNPALADLFQRYSGPQIRYDARLNSFINEEIEKPADQRRTILDLAKAYKDMIEKEGFQNVQDINRVITLCQTGEKANLLGYVLQYLFPAVSTRVAQAVKARNDSIQVWMKDYGARICLADNLSIKDSEASFRTVTMKDFFKSSLVLHNQTATAPVKTFNKTLWCSIVKPKAIEGGCWDPATDDTLTPETVCAP